MNVYEIVTNRIIAELEKGVIPWKKSWTGQVPTNLISKKEYSGINVLLLSINSFGSPYYLTYKQALEKGGNVKKGEKGHIIIFWKWLETKKDEDDEEVKRYPILRYYTVFNVEQCEGIDYPKPKKINNKIARCENIVGGYKSPPKITKHLNRAFYSPQEDKIGIPEINTFEKASDYYATLFHELIHSTGHKTRLDRFDGTNGTFGSEPYGKEELIAEVGSAFLCSKMGIGNAQIKQSAGYIQGWLKALKDDHRFIIVASGKARKAVEFIEGKKDSKIDS